MKYAYVARTIDGGNGVPALRRGVAAAAQSGPTSARTAVPVTSSSAGFDHGFVLKRSTRSAASHAALRGRLATADINARCKRLQSDRESVHCFARTAQCGASAW